MSVLELVAIASASAAAAEAEQHAPSIHQIWFPLGNFLIFLWIIKRFAMPLVRDFLRSRREQVLAFIQDAAESKRRVEQIVEDYRGRLARLDQEAASIERSLRDEGQRQKGKLLEEAAELAKKIEEDARFLADQEVKVARQKIRDEMAEQAEAGARDLVQRALTRADQDRLNQEFISRLEQHR